jgi:hypothetical protein
MPLQSAKRGGAPQHQAEGNMQHQGEDNMSCDSDRAEQNPQAIEQGCSGP